MMAHSLDEWAETVSHLVDGWAEAATHPVYEWVEDGRPDYAHIADLEHQEAIARPEAGYLPHWIDEVRRSCAVCAPPPEPTGAQVIELRPGAATPAPVEGPGTVEERSEGAVPAVPGPVVEGVVVPREDDEPLLPWRAQQVRRPVIAKWARNAEERRLAAEWALRYAGHTVAFHALRTPLYAARTVAYAPRGVGRTVAAGWRWLWDAEGKPLRSGAVQGGNTAEYMALSRQRNDRVKTRLVVAAIGASGAVIGWWVGSLFVPHLGLYTIVLAVLAAGAAGRNRDKPLIDDPVISDPAAMRLTSGQIVRALGALGISEINKALAKNGDGISFAYQIGRDGPGWRADIDLPPGVTPMDVMEKRDRLASGLRRPVGAVWPEPAPEIHAARMVLWVGDQDMNKTRQAPWPLLKRGRTSVFDTLPFGTDQRGRNVSMPVMYTNLLIGALPGAGKTFSLRVPLLGAALDPTCELRVFELKGSGDLSSLEKVAHHYGSGPGDDETLEACLQSLREVAADVRRRAKTIAGLPKDLAKENKVTPEIAARRSLRLWPLVFAIDECQNLFLSPYGKEAAELCIFIIRIGRAFGVSLWLATQRPDKDSLPTGITANVGTRFCLRVMGQVENDMILGTSAYQNGIRATTFTINDLGIGYLVGAGPEPKITHSYNIKNDQADQVTDRARELRAAEGTLTGHALGDVDVEPAPAAADLLTDVAAVFGGEEKVWSVTLIERLRELRPGTYDSLTAIAFGNQMREAYGLRTQDVWGVVDGREVNWKGLARDQVMAAVAKRRADG